jgi:hypothetical protein
MSDDKQEVNRLSETHDAETNVGKNEGRRQFLKRSAVLTSAPVLLSFISRPAFGVFCTPSSIGSSTFLSHHPEETNCGGFSPGAWKNNNLHADGYDADGEKTKLFSQVFVGNWHGGGDQSLWNSNTTLQQVLDNYFPGVDSPKDQYEFGAHAIAAYLNAYYHDQTNYPMTVADVLEMVNAIITDGQYEPTPGYVMYPQNVVEFIQQTFFDYTP